MKSLLIKIIQNMDKIYLKPHLSIFNDLKGILCLCFHTVFENKKEKENNQTLPWLGLTIEEYRKGFSNKDIHDIKIPPILPIRHNIDLYESCNTHSHLK